MLSGYSLFDKKTGAYEKPVWAPHVEDVFRSLRLMLEDPKNSYTKFAADYSVYRVGHFEQDTGVILPPAHGAPEHVTELVALFPSIPPKGGAQ